VGVVRVLWAVGGLLPERPVRHGPLDLGEASVGDAAGVARVLAPDRSRRSNKQLISRFRAQLLEACRSELSRLGGHLLPGAGRGDYRQVRAPPGPQFLGVGAPLVGAGCATRYLVALKRDVTIVNLPLPSTTGPVLLVELVPVST
jgi:hypothetical protein